MAPHSSTLAWKIPWTEEPGRLQSRGSQRVGHDWATSLSLFTFIHWRRKWQPTLVFLPGGSQGRGSLVGCRLRGLTASDTTEVVSSSSRSLGLGLLFLRSRAKALEHHSVGDSPVHLQPSGPYLPQSPRTGLRCWGSGGRHSRVHPNVTNLYPQPFLSFFLNFILFNFTILYWFCHISKWICHRYTCVPHPEPSSHLPLPSLPPPPSPYHPSGSSQCTSPKHPVSCIKPGLATRFIHDIIHASMPFSQIFPPSPSPPESIRLFYTSVSLLLSRTQGYCYHLSKFHIYVLVYCIGVFLSGLLHSECWFLSLLFHSPLSLSSRGSSVPLHFLPLEWYHLHIWCCWYFSWFQLVSHPAQHFSYYSEYKLNKQCDIISKLSKFPIKSAPFTNMNLDFRSKEWYVD